MLKDVSKGDSISASGACLTVEEFEGKSFSFFLAEETLQKTWFSVIEKGDRLNLERSLKSGDRMGGHYFQGHVDTTSEVLEIEELEEGWNYTFRMAEGIS